MTNILLSTLGTWGVIPELFGFVNSNDFNLYKNSDKLSEINKLRETIQPVDQVWLIGSGGSFAKEAIEKIENWRNKVSIKQKIFYFLPDGINDLTTTRDCYFMANLIYRVVYNAKLQKKETGGQLILSLAGGRKTMGSNLQDAAHTFGCDYVLHIISDDTFNSDLKKINFLAAFPKKLANAVMPIVIFKNLEPNYALLTDNLNKKLLPFKFKKIKKENIIDNSVDFYNLIQSEKEKSRSFVFNIADTMYGDSKNSNFTALYLLKPNKLQILKNMKIGTTPSNYKKEYEIIKKIPKVELHCHLGGILDSKELVEVAQTLEDTIITLRKTHTSFNNFLKEIEKAVSEKNIVAVSKLIDNSIKKLRTKFTKIKEPYTVTAFLLCFNNNIGLLDKFIFGNYRSKESFVKIGIKKYETLGDLQGSGLLQHKKTIKKTVKILTDKTRKHNVKYLELRCSPVNYTRGGLTAIEVYNIIQQELEKDKNCTYGIIFIASRHGKQENITKHMDLALDIVKNQSNKNVKLVGIDVAGDENAKKPSELRKDLIPIMEKCLKITIHAGETEGVGNIWEAVYHLNAERIGHGLNLLKNQQLLSHFLDRKITVELCPSSNNQIVGYKNFAKINNCKNIYPLKDYLHSGLKVCINTDNPGISRTDFTNEYLHASTLCENGLSLWQVLILIRNGFKAAFIDYDTRRKVLRAVEKEIVSVISEVLDE